MFPRHGHTNCSVKLLVTVTDVTGLQRVMTMLTGRNHEFTRFEAEEAGSGRWTVRFDLRADPRQLELVVARLHRVPSVLGVVSHPGSVLSAAG